MLTDLLSLSLRRMLPLFLAGFIAAAPMPALALGEDLQCVPYARQLSGIQIYGDAHTWWKQADGRYARGHQPQIGAVLAFRPHSNMRLGHVATVSRIIDSRTMLVDHSNWSTIDGTRGHIERGVKVVDVSKRNDWSKVRVWYTPIGALGGTKWPTYGFIYPGDAPIGQPVMVAETPQPNQPVKPGRQPSRNLLAQVDADWVKRAAAREQAPPAPAPVARPARPAPTPASVSKPASKPAYPQKAAGYTPSSYGRAAPNEPRSIDDLLARY